jgi:toxin HigB-1
MDVEFRDQNLALVETSEAHKTKLPVSVINSLRDKLVVIRAAPDERVLRRWKSLHYEKLSGRSDERSIRLNEKWRLIVTVDATIVPNKLIILGVEDYH